MSDAPTPEGPREERVAATAGVHPISRLLGFLDTPVFATALTWAIGIAAVALALVDLVHHRHRLFTWEGFVGFHGWFGFLAFSFVVLAGWPLRALLSRPEDYYGEGEGDDA